MFSMKQVLRLSLSLLFFFKRGCGISGEPTGLMSEHMLEAWLQSLALGALHSKQEGRVIFQSGD